MSTLVSDLRHTLRAMRTSPGSTVLAVVMVALGIGATTAMFSVFYSVLLHPLPFREPERLVQIWESRSKQGWTQAAPTELNFWDLRQRNRSFEDLGGLLYDDGILTGSGSPELVSVGRVSAGFFTVLGVRFTAGRDFALGEDQPDGQNQVAIVGNRFWKRRFGGETGLVGQTIRLNDKNYVVAGVLPPGEPWLNVADVFVPLVYNPKASRTSFELSVIGRLKPGVTIEAAGADLTAVSRAIAQQHPQVEGMGVTLQPGSVWVAGDNLRLALWTLLGAVGCLLLIACVNLANMLLARTTNRTRELAVRAALGAGRARIVRLVLTESLGLTALGAALGLLIAMWAVDLLKLAEPSGIPRIAESSINTWVLAFALAATILTGFFAGLVPAWRAPYASVVTALREGERGQTGGRSRGRLRSVLVAAEVALSLILLIGAGLLIRSFTEVLSVDRGFQAENRLLFTVNLSSTYKMETAQDMLSRFLARVESLPGVVSASAVNVRPLSGGSPGMAFAAAGKPLPGGRAPWAGWRRITPHHFQTLGIPLLKGRLFTEHDPHWPPRGVIISKNLADLLWPGEDPVGQKAVLWHGQGNLPAEVVGVVGNMRERSLEAGWTRLVYLPTRALSPMQFVVHTAGEPLSMVPALRSALAEVDANLPFAEIATLEQVVNRSTATRSFNTVLLAVFAGLALLLALAGIYGVLAYAVARRTPEIGLRVALGATQRNILSLMIGQGMRPILVGIAVGLLGAAGLSRLLVTLLFAVHPEDPVTYAGVAAGVAATALAACYVPARRALRVDPVVALREE